MNKVKIFIENVKNNEGRKILDHEVVDIRISHDIEKVFAKAEVVIFNEKVSDDNNDLSNINDLLIGAGDDGDYYFGIMVGDRVIFKGSVDSITTLKQSDKLLKIGLTAKPKPKIMEALLVDLLESLRGKATDSQKPIEDISILLLGLGDNEEQSLSLQNLMDLYGVYVYCCPASIKFHIVSMDDLSKGFIKQGEPGNDHNMEMEIDDSLIIEGSFSKKTRKEDIGNYINGTSKSPGLDKVSTSTKVRIHASWVQWQSAVIDLSQAIGKSFGAGLLNTLTGDSLKKSWWKSEAISSSSASSSLSSTSSPSYISQLGGSGYRVIDAGLIEVDPPKTGALNLYPRFHGKYAGDYYVKHSWFNPVLRVLCNYKQPRIEVLEFSLDYPILSRDGLRKEYLDFFINYSNLVNGATVWESGKYYKRHEKVIVDGFLFLARSDHKSREIFASDSDNWIKLLSIESLQEKQSHCSFFLLSDRDKQAVRVVDYIGKILKHKVMLDAISGVEYGFSIPMWKWLGDGGILLGSFIKLNKGGKVERGFLKSINLVFDGNGQKFYCDLKLSGSSFNDNGLLLKQISYADNLMDNLHNKLLKLQENSAIRDSFIRANIKGINWDIKRFPQRLVGAIRITNKPEEQLYKLNQCSGSLKSKSDLLKVMDEIAMGIEVDLFDLRSSGELEHRIDLDKINDYRLINN